MRAVTKKILEAGLIDKHVQAMLTRWGALEGIIPPEELPEMKRLDTKQKLEQFVEELEELIDQESEVMRETTLDLPLLKERFFYSLGFDKPVFLAYKDSFGRILVPTDIPLKRGTKLYCAEPPHGNGKVYKVLDWIKLYQGEKVIALSATITEAEK